ncbi:MAG: glycosyltransferase family 2 protein [Bacteroidales bacterium]|nr:glycosyltransferase family 2 protein [Bacteroidales bacterium]
MDKSAMDISVVIPIYNESDNLEALHRRLTERVSSLTADYELIFVNDGSLDDSLPRLRMLAAADPHVFYVNFSRNFGHQIAVTAGLDYARGQAVVIIDGDLQDPPELIPELYRKYREGYEVVYAQREKRKGESWFKKATAKWFYRILRRITNIRIPVDTGDFRQIDRKVVDCLKRMPEKNKFLRGQIAWIGFRQTAVFFERQERLHGKTGYPFAKMLKFALDGITGFSDKPLAWVTKAGFCISALSFVIIIYALCSHFIFKQTVSGWTSIIVSGVFLGGIQLFSLGIIGEYVNRINKNVLNRPLYIVESTNAETDGF